MNWKYFNNKTEIIEKLSNVKVSHVTETRLPPFIVKWTGELDNDFYFSIMFVSGVVMVACEERQMLLTNNEIPIAYCEEIEDVIQSKSYDEIFKKSKCMSNMSEIAKTIQFQEIMRIFNMEFISDNVEIFETNLL